MQQSESISATALLHILLDRYEAPIARVRDVTQPIDYTKVGGPVLQDKLHDQLKEAEKAGAIRLERGPLSRTTGEFARIRLISAPALYEFLGRLPTAATALTAREYLLTALPFANQDTFFSDLVDEATRRWRESKVFLGFSHEEVTSLAEVLTLAHGIMNLSGPDMDHRTFSRRAVRDSKALERWEGRVSQVLRRVNTSLITEEPREVLEAFGIVRRSHPLFVKGPLVIQTRNLTLEGTGQPFLGLPLALIRKVEAFSAPIDYVLIIENPTSFWRYCSEVSGYYVALLSDGFPARDVLQGIIHLVRMARKQKNTPVYHWGDIDAGGVRIAAHLSDALGVDLSLHEMDYELVHSRGTPLKSRQGLRQLAQREDIIGRLAKRLLEDGALGLEQEELDPRAPN